ncbi:MAG: HAD hydrolase-like protein [Gemmatimonadota bacterium]
MIDCVAFDFDGVLVESNAGKRDAYFEVFSDLPGASSDVIRTVLEKNSGADRFGVINAVLDAVTIQSGPIWSSRAALTEQLANRYNDICEQLAANCPEVHGASAMLTELSDIVPLYIVSLTPESPLRRIVVCRGWARHFHGVLGLPTSKAEHLRNILVQQTISPDELLFVGDHDGDLKAARSVGCRFIGLQNEFNDFQSGDFPIVSAVPEVLELVRSVRC